MTCGLGVSLPACRPGLGLSPAISGRPSHAPPHSGLPLLHKVTSRDLPSNPMFFYFFHDLRPHQAQSPNSLYLKHPNQGQEEFRRTLQGRQVQIFGLHVPGAIKKEKPKLRVHRKAVKNSQACQSETWWPTLHRLFPRNYMNWCSRKEPRQVRFSGVRTLRHREIKSLCPWPPSWEAEQPGFRLRHPACWARGAAGTRA